MHSDFFKRMALFEVMGIFVIFIILLVEKLKLYLLSIDVERHSSSLSLIAAVIVAISMFFDLIIFWRLIKKKVDLLNAKLQLVLMSIFLGLTIAGIMFILEK